MEEVCLGLGMQKGGGAWALGPAHWGLNLSFAPFPLCELVNFTSLSASRFPHLEKDLIMAPPHRMCLGPSEMMHEQDREYS